MISNIRLLILSFVISQSLTAQDVPPALMVTGATGATPLKVSALQIETKIHGFLAETHMTMTFYNSSSQVLSGDLYFPLPEGSTVSGYALDIEGSMVEGVVVEKTKARTVFEKIVRQGIDPGLVEWVKGNSFKTRVFPIPAHGTRIIRVSYHSSITGEDTTPGYLIPLKFTERIDEFSIRIEVVSPTAVPIVAQSDVAGLAFSHWRGSYVAEMRAQNVLASQDIIVELVDQSANGLMLERSNDGVAYYALRTSPRTPPSFPETTPRRITVLWDASQSRKHADHAREMDILNRYFLQLHSPLLTVDIVVFRNRAESVRTFEVKDSDGREVMSFLQNIIYDGGTQLGSVSLDTGTDFYLLFTDGMSNFGTPEPEKSATPLYIISSSSVTNHVFLRSLAAASGGAYFNLANIPVATVVELIGKPVFSFLRARVDEGSIITAYPEHSQPISGSFILSGILASDSARVTLEFGVGEHVTDEISYAIDLSDAYSGELTRIMWAQKKLDSLQSNPRKNHTAIVALGKRHGLVTPGTSLIVLDRLEQYIEHEIAPPNSNPEMRKQYFAAVGQQKREEDILQANKLEWVLDLWEQRIAWWETTFNFPKSFIYQEQEANAGASEGEEEPQTPLLAQSEFSAAEPMSEIAEEEDESGLQEKSRAVDADQEPKIALKPWDPVTPYLIRIKEAQPRAQYQAYIHEREEFGASPAFYLDCGDFFLNHGRADLAVRIWSNLVELELENPALLRVFAHRMAQEGLLTEARMLFEEVLRLRPEEPQSYRDLALVLGRMADYSKAIDLLFQVVIRAWDRFQEIELIALTELNALIPLARAAGQDDYHVDERFVHTLDVDVRIILTWDVDLTDMDLWVIEPSGEKAYYGHTRTTIGGNFSRDFTQGYGPEEYMVRKAMSGEYHIQVNYFSSSAPILLGSVTLQVDVFTNYGRINEQHRSLTVRLTESTETIDVGTIRIK